MHVNQTAFAFKLSKVVYRIFFLRTKHAPTLKSRSVRIKSENESFFPNGGSREAPQDLYPSSPPHAKESAAAGISGKRLQSSLLA